MKGLKNGHQCNTYRQRYNITRRTTTGCKLHTYVKIDKLVFVSGQVSQNENGFIKGVLGKDLNVEEGYDAARQCAISLLAQLKSAVNGDLNKVTKVVKLGGFVNSAQISPSNPTLSMEHLIF